jgi:hypothetical protein
MNFLNKPLSRDFLLSRGSCCYKGCINCPYIMSYNLFLDDYRKPIDVTWLELPMVEWIIVKNYDQFVQTICSLGMPKRITFDHDLADEHYPWTPENQEAYKNTKDPLIIPYNKYKEKTGYECVKWLVNYCMERGHSFPEYYVHTMNPIGKQNIISYIESFKKRID